jgi:hypothetical protein
MGEDFRANDAGNSPSISSMLEALAATDSSIGFIYSAMRLLADRYRINDAAVVLVGDSFGTQMFRLKGRAVNADLVGDLASRPGVYCTPNIVPQSELDAVYSACQESFSSRFVRHNSSHNASDQKENVNVSSDVLESIGSPSQSKLERLLTSTIHYARMLRRDESSSHKKVARTFISEFLILVDITVFVMTAAGIHGPLRLMLGLILGVVIPGWCVVGPLKLDNVPLEIGLTLAMSLSLLIVIAQLLMTFDLWHLVALEEVCCVVSLPPLFLLAKSSRKDGRHSR